MNNLAPDSYVALCLAYAGRFQQLYAQAKTDSQRALYIEAAAYCLDRTTPSPEVGMHAHRATSRDPIHVLISARNLIQPTPALRWRKPSASLRRPEFSPYLDALDLVLQASPRAKIREGFVLDWLAPFLKTEPELDQLVRGCFS